MKNEIPRPVVIGIVVAAVVIGGGFLAMQFVGGGPGAMTSDDVKRAEMQAEAGNQRMAGYVPPGTPGGPPQPGPGQGSGMSGEAAARQQLQGQAPN